MQSDSGERIRKAANEKCGDGKGASRNAEKERELGAWIVPGGEGPRAPLMLGASTWPGEDEVMLRIYRRLLSEEASKPRPLLAIAPRHFEKADAVEANILKAGFRCVRRSRGDVRPADGGPAVFLADTTGELMGLFALADKVFLGKSLCARGSQNMIEPCFCGKPTAVGPHTENFRPVMSDLLEADAIVQVRDEAELERFFLSDQTALASRAAAAVERRRGVVGRCVRKLLEEIA